MAIAELKVAASGLFSPGPNSVTVTNDDQFGHTLVTSDDTGRVIEATNVIAAGEQLSLTVNLPPGAYELSCRIVVQTADGTLVDHYEEGMVTTINITSAS